MRTARMSSAIVVIALCLIDTGVMGAGPIDRESILADSDVHYVESGGIAGFMTSATLQANKGEVTVEYRPPRSRPSTTPHTGTLTDDEYLEVWKQLEDADVWSLAPAPPPPRGADMIGYELRVRLGSKSRRIVWVEGDGSAAAKALAKVADAIRQAAERAALLR
jgi:hypothetical protein